MAGEDAGVEILDGAVSTTSSAVTHEIDKRNVRVDSTRADDDDGASAAASSAAPVEDQGETDAPNTGGDEEQQAALAAAGMETEEEAGVGSAAKSEDPQARAPYDEKREVPSAAAAVPISHVAPQAATHADDVSSLQHTEGKESRASGHRSRGHRHHRQVQEQSKVDDAVEEGTAEYYQEEEDVEQQKALQRRNMLIIVVLLIFLGLVIAIGVGVGLAVKNSDPAPDGSKKEEEETGPPPEAQPKDDDEYQGIGGGVEVEESAVPSAAPSNAGPCIPVEIGIIFDNYSDETGWMLVKDNYHPEDPDKNVVVWQSKFYNKQEFSGRADTMERCFPQGYYTFVFTDKEGDGLCCYHGEGSYVLSSEGKVIKIGGAMTSNEESVVFELPFVEPEPVDRDGDGRDDRLGHLMPYDSSSLVEGVDCENFRMVVQTDEYGIETTWELYEGRDKKYGTLVADGGPYGGGYPYVTDYCLASPKEYVLYVYDWDRRGLCCESGEGFFKVESRDIVIVPKTGKFREENVTRFVLPADGSVTLSDDPTPSPSLFAEARKTLYPTVTPTTRGPTSPPTTPQPTTPPPTARESTPFPTLSGQDVVDVGGLPTTLGKGEKGNGQ